MSPKEVAQTFFENNDKLQVIFVTNKGNAFYEEYLADRFCAKQEPRQTYQKFERAGFSFQADVDKASDIVEEVVGVVVEEVDYDSNFTKKEIGNILEKLEIEFDARSNKSELVAFASKNISKEKVLAFLNENEIEFSDQDELIDLLKTL